MLGLLLSEITKFYTGSTHLKLLSSWYGIVGEILLNCLYNNFSLIYFSQKIFSQTCPSGRRVSRIDADFRRSTRLVGVQLIPQRSNKFNRVIENLPSALGVHGWSRKWDTEFVQLFVPARAFNVLDWVSNISWLMLGVLVIKFSGSKTRHTQSDGPIYFII